MKSINQENGWYSFRFNKFNYSNTEQFRVPIQAENNWRTEEGVSQIQQAITASYWVLWNGAEQGALSVLCAFDFQIPFSFCFFIYGK